MYDVVVIGGGPAGYASALYAHNFGLSVALVEKERPGGTCLLRGCIPAKQWLHTAEVFSTGTDMVPHGEVKVLQEGMTVEISCPQIGRLRHGAAQIPERGELNLDYSRLEFQTGVTHGR